MVGYWKCCCSATSTEEGIRRQSIVLKAPQSEAARPKVVAFMSACSVQTDGEEFPITLNPL